MKKIIIICPYFGKLPKDTFPLWLLSCKENPTVNWLIITDDKTQYSFPENVRVSYSTLEQFKKKAQKRLGFTISLESSYKLCDFKPTYGYILEDEIKKYDYWGYCDISDCIFGDIRKYITDELLQEYDKVGILGHFCLYKNTRENNRRFMLKSDSKTSYKEVLRAKNNMAFDELRPYSINTIYEKYNYKICRIEKYYYDISPLHYAFRRCVLNQDLEFTCEKNKHTFFEWKNGKLARYSVSDNRYEKEELLYVHFQKRKMRKYFSELTTSFYIFPKGFIRNINIDDMKKIKASTIDRLYLPYFKLKCKSLKYRLKKLL